VITTVTAGCKMAGKSTLAAKFLYEKPNFTWLVSAAATSETITIARSEPDGAGIGDADDYDGGKAACEAMLQELKLVDAARLSMCAFAGGKPGARRNHSRSARSDSARTQRGDFTQFFGRGS
jgi:hypothetical protein